jgi:hypothetical protein
MRKINSTTLEFKRKKKELMPYLLQGKAWKNNKSHKHIHIQNTNKTNA